MYCTVKFKSGELDPANRKVFMYSGHDTTIAPILHTLGRFSHINIYSLNYHYSTFLSDLLRSQIGNYSYYVFEPPIPPTYATILFELLIYSLDVFDPPIAPAYAATILFELLEKEGVLSLQVSYKNESGDPFILTIPGCTQRCPLDKLKGKFDPI